MLDFTAGAEASSSRVILPDSSRRLGQTGSPIRSVAIDEPRTEIEITEESPSIGLFPVTFLKGGSPLRTLQALHDKGKGRALDDIMHLPTALATYGRDSRSRSGTEEDMDEETCKYSPKPSAGYTYDVFQAG
jgi:hypothetical protein